MTQTYLISGANRGIGLGLVQSLIQRPDVKIYAGVRDISKPSALTELAERHHGKIAIVQLVAGSVEDAKAAAELIEKEEGHIDVLIANAGISEYYAPLATSDLHQFTNHFNVNVLGPVVLYQQLRDLLLKSSQPKYIGISTGAGSVGNPFPVPATTYMASKAALNMVIQKIAQEEETFVAIAISPGWVQTDMGNFGAKSNGLEQAPVTLADSVTGVLKLVDESSKDTHNGIFWSYDGEKLVW